MSDTKKILILQTGDLVQTLLTTPLLRLLKSQLMVELDVACSHALALAENPYIDNIHPLNEGITAMGKQLRGNSYDLLIDLNNSSKSRAFTRAVRPGQVLRMAKEGLRRWVFIRLGINQLDGVNYAEKAIRLAEPLGLKPDSRGIEVFVPESGHVESDWLPHDFAEGYVVLSLHAAKYTRRTPLEKLLELCDRINKPILLVGDEGDAEDAKAIVEFFEKRPEGDHYEEGLKKLNKKSIVFDATGKFSFHQIASVVRQANHVFTGDSFVAQLAAAFHKKPFITWGSSVPLFGYYPYNARFTVFENNKLDCRPCSVQGYDRCPKGHFDCMNKIVFDFYLP